MYESHDPTEVVAVVSRAVDAPGEAARGTFRRRAPAPGRRRASPPQPADAGDRARAGRGAEGFGTGSRPSGHALNARKHRGAAELTASRRCLPVAVRSAGQVGRLQRRVLVIRTAPMRADGSREMRQPKRSLTRSTIRASPRETNRVQIAHARGRWGRGTAQGRIDSDCCPAGGWTTSRLSRRPSGAGDVAP